MPSPDVAVPSAEQGSSLRKTLLRSAAQYSLGSAVGMAASVARVGLAARWLSPELAGAWLGLQLLVNYGANLHMGVLFGMLRNVPLHRGKGEDAQAEEVKETSFSFSLLMGVIGSVLIAVGLRFVDEAPAARYVNLTAILVLINLVRSYYVSLAKAESAFRDLSISAAAGSFVAVLSLPLMRVAALDGLIWGMLAQAAVESAYLARALGLPKLSLRLGVLRPLLAVGFLALTINAVVTFLTSIDRTVMLQRLGAAATGQYYLGANAIALLPVIVGLPSAVLTPKFFERFGKTGKGADLLPLIEYPTAIMAPALSALLGVCALFVAPVVSKFWPNLVPGIGACRVALVATCPIVMAGLMTNIFYATNRQGVQVAMGGICALVTYGLAWGLSLVWPSITTIAAACCVGLLAYDLATIHLAFRLMDQPGRVASRYALFSLLPFAYAGVIFVVVDRVLEYVWPAASFLRATVGALVFTIAMVPYLLRSLRTLRGGRPT